MVSNKPVTLPDERGRFGDFGGKFVPETVMAALAEQPASGGGTRWEIIVAEFRPIRIKYRDKDSTSTQSRRFGKMPLVATETALPSKVSYTARTTVF